MIPSQPSSPRLPESGRAPVQRSGQQDSILGRTQSALWPVFSTGFGDPLCEAQEAPTTGRLSSGASGSLSLQGERSYLGTKGTLKKCICFGGKCQNIPSLQRTGSGRRRSQTDNLANASHMPERPKSAPGPHGKAGQSAVGPTGLTASLRPWATSTCFLSPNTVACSTNPPIKTSLSHPSSFYLALNGSLIIWARHCTESSLLGEPTGVSHTLCDSLITGLLAEQAGRAGAGVRG